MQNIIVASDLSPRSRPAIKRAVELAVGTGANLTVLTVINDEIPKDLAHPLKVGATTFLTEMVNDDTDGRSLDFNVEVVMGDPIEVINETVGESGFDLLVVGLHRRRKFLDQIRETTMEHIIRSCRIPVLLVAGPVEAPYREVLSGVAYSSVCTSVVQMIPKVAPQANVTLFHAHPASFQKEALHEFETWISVFGLPKALPEPILIEGMPRDALDDLMAKAQYDLLAIGGHTRSDGGRYFVGRFTAGLIRNPPCDLLISK